MDRDEALRLLRGGEDGIREWNKRREQGERIPALSRANLSEAELYGANLCGAKLGKADLFRADLRDADLTGANLKNADLLGASLSGANLSDADLQGANLWYADLHGTVLTQANLANANLTLCRFIKCDLSEATVENAIVQEIQIEQLSGLPNPPTVLRPDLEGKRAAITGEEAASFFLTPEVVKVVLDRPLRPESLGGYYSYIAECEARSHWPEGVAYLGGHVEGGQTVLSFQAPKASNVVGSLSILLSPFRQAGAVDFQKMLTVFSEEQAEPVVEAVLARPEFRSLIAERLQQFEGFADAKPSEIRTGGGIFKLEMDPKVVAELQPGAILAPQLTVIEEGGHMSTQNIYGGRFQGCSFGDHNSLTNYFGAVEEATIPEDDIKEKLKEARQAIEALGISDDDKEDLVEQLTKLTAALEETERDPSRVKRFWDRIQDVAPTVANILSSAASLSTMLSVG